MRFIVATIFSMMVFMLADMLIPGRHPFIFIWIGSVLANCHYIIFDK